MIERRSDDRRIKQLSEAEGWDGIERRIRDERRRGRRKEQNEMLNMQDPKARKKMELKKAREEKERIISERRRKGNKRKEIIRGQ